MNNSQSKNSTKEITLAASSPIVVYVILGMILIVYMFPVTFGVLRELGIHRVSVAKGEYWRFFSSLFVHTDLRHLLLNSILLLFFGLKVERVFGPWRFTTLFIVSGIMGGVFSYLLGKASLSVGSSGAIFGLMGTTIVYYYSYRDQLGEVAKNNLAYAVGILIVNFIYGFIQPNIDNWAHIGGLIAGTILAYLILPKYELAEKTPNKFFEFETDKEKQVALRTGSVFLFISFILNFESIFFVIRYFSTFLEKDFLTLLILISVPVKFVVALELWRSNKRIYWLLWLLVFYSIGVAIVRLIGAVTIGGESSIGMFYLIGGVIAQISLNIPLIVLLLGQATKTRRWISIAIFVLGYASIQVWFLFQRY